MFLGAEMTISKRIKSILDKNNLQINFKIQDSNPSEGKTAEFVVEDNCIYFYKDKIAVNFTPFQDKCTMEEYYEILLCHELGHIPDQALNHMYSLRKELKDQINSMLNSNNPLIEDTMNLVEDLGDLIIKIEEAAWKNGNEYISSNLVECYDEMNRKNIEKTKEDAADLVLNIEMDLLNRQNRQ